MEIRMVVDNYVTYNLSQGIRFFKIQIGRPKQDGQLFTVK